ncbi:hypothetical protein D3C86_1979030 [compost metagenome]
MAITSFAFMLVCVPEPVCQTVSGKCASNAPLRTSAAAATMADAISASSAPHCWLATAAAILCRPKAWIRQSGKRSLPMPNTASARWVWAPQ